MKKFLLSVAVALAAIAGMNAQTVVLQENFDATEAVDPATGKHVFGKNPWTGADAEGVSYQPNFKTYKAAVANGTYPDVLNGWTCRATNNTMYPCQGYVRISKTSVGGDLISPKLTALTEATDLEVTWQGIGYTSNYTFNDDGSYKSGGVHDYQAYCVGVVGAGEVEEATAKVKYYDAEGAEIELPVKVINIPTDCFIDPADTLSAWQKEGTWASAKIKGATAETQVVFVSTNIDGVPVVGGDFPEIATDAPHGTKATINRVIFDNITIKTVGEGSSVEDIAAKAVAGVRYYNLMGVESAEPFEGVCIVKTVYTDGTSTVAKVLR